MEEGMVLIIGMKCWNLIQTTTAGPNLRQNYRKQQGAPKQSPSKQVKYLFLTLGQFYLKLTFSTEPTCMLMVKGLEFEVFVIITQVCGKKMFLCSIGEKITRFSSMFLGLGNGIWSLDFIQLQISLFKYL